MTDEEYLSQISKVEIYCEILLGILRNTNVKTYPTEEEQVKQLTKKLKFQNLSHSSLENNYLNFNDRFLSL